MLNFIGVSLYEIVSQNSLFKLSLTTLNSSSFNYSFKVASQTLLMT